LALTEMQKAQVNKLLTAYCAKRVPERPAFRPPHDWQEMVIAKFTYIGTQHEWRLYCQHRDLRWHSYQALPAASSLAKLLDEVDADPTGIFWG
jgi:hypothetical protein